MTVRSQETLDLCLRCHRPRLPGAACACAVLANTAAPPASIGPYAVRGLIGQGKGTLVYACEDTAGARPVAIKLLVASDPDTRRVVTDRFRREARALALLRHPNLLAIHAIGEANGCAFVVTERVSGPSIEALIKRQGRLSPRDALIVVLEAARGLRAAAERGVIHRDVKPTNLLLGRDRRIKVTDFGFARPIRTDGALASRPCLGTPAYMAPEQAQGGVVDRRADIYCLGICLYRMLTGELPYQESDPVRLLVQQVVEPLPDPRRRVPDLAPAVLHVLARMTAKQADRRYPSYESLIDEVEKAIARLSGRWSRPGAVASLGMVLGLALTMAAEAMLSAPVAAGGSSAALAALALPAAPPPSGVASEPDPDPAPPARPEPEEVAYVLASDEARASFVLDPGRGDMRRKGGRLVLGATPRAALLHRRAVAGDVAFTLDCELRPGAEIALLLRAVDGAEVRAVFSRAQVRLESSAAPALTAAVPATLTWRPALHLELRRVGGDVLAYVNDALVLRDRIALGDRCQAGVATTRGTAELRFLRLQADHIL